MKLRYRRGQKSFCMHGFVYEYHPCHFAWTNFVYEELFNFCKKYGKIGHKSLNYRISMETSQRNFDKLMAEVWTNFENLMVRFPLSHCYSNKIIGLRRIELLCTSRFDLTSYPRMKFHFVKFYLNQLCDPILHLLRRTRDLGLVHVKGNLIKILRYR